MPTLAVGMLCVF